MLRNSLSNLVRLQVGAGKDDEMKNGVFFGTICEERKNRIRDLDSLHELSSWPDGDDRKAIFPRFRHIPLFEQSLVRVCGKLMHNLLTHNLPHELISYRFVCFLFTTFCCNQLRDDENFKVFHFISSFFFQRR